MTALNPRSRLVLAGLEATIGVDPGLVVGTDDLFVSMDSAGIKLGVTQVSNEPASPTGYELPSAIATIKPSATYIIPLYGLGKANGEPVLPKWMSVFLTSCGHVDQSVSGGAVVTWTPDSIFPRNTDPSSVTTASDYTFTVYDFLARDGDVFSGTKILQKMVGCRVTQVRLTLTVGQWAALEVDVLGLSVEPASVSTSLLAATLDTVRTDFVRANAAQSSINIGGAIALNSQATSWAIDFAGSQEEGDASNAGVAMVGTRQCMVTGSMNPILATANIAAYNNAQFDQTFHAYSMVGSMTPEGRTVDDGFTIRVAAPAVQIIYDYDMSGSAVRLPTTLKAVSADSTTPPISLSLS